MKIADRQTEKILNILGWSGYKTQPLVQHGSDRLYSRLINLHDNTSVIHMIYDSEKTENNYFLYIHNFLKKIGIPVPDIISCNPDMEWIFLQDLGDTTLYTLKGNIHTSELKKLYYLILDSISVLYTEGYKQYLKNPFKTAEQFGYQLYRWEQKYFTDNYLILYRNIPKVAPELQKDFDLVASVLSSCPNRIVHRDLQSKNIMVYNRKPYFIDFQGVRLGLPEYDLASLIYDPYMNLNNEFKEDLIKYCEQTMVLKWQVSAIKHFRKNFVLCSIQRIMQALGAYCFLGIHKKKYDFLQYIPVAETILLNQLKKANILHPLIRILYH